LVQSAMCPICYPGGRAKLGIRDRAQTGMLPAGGLVGVAGAERVEISVVHGANAVGCTHCSVGRAEGAHAAQMGFDLPRVAAEMPAIRTQPLRRRRRRRTCLGTHWPSLVQKSTKTWVDST
jgi:hypothetical protein